MSELDNIRFAIRAFFIVFGGIAFRSAAKRYGWGMPGLLYALFCVEASRWP